MKKLDRFLSEIFKSGIEHTVVQTFLPDVGEYKKRKVPIILFPKSIAEIHTILQWANDFRIDLYPYSTGKNWGFGSKVPVKTNSVLVELRNLKKIRSFDTSNQIVVLEPGVTQKQLSNYLKDKNFIANLTSSSPGSSVLGNTLDNGIGYLGRKINDLAGIELIAGNGSMHHFGYLAKETNSDHIYEWIPQAGLGIVTAIAIKLAKKPAQFIMVQLVFKITVIGKIVSLLSSYYKSKKIKWTCKWAQWDLDHYHIIIPIVNSVNSYSIKRELSAFGTVSIYNAKKVATLGKSNEIVSHWNLYTGIPTSTPISYYNPVGNKEINLDVFSTTGIKLLAHIIPFTGKAIQKINRLLESLAINTAIHVTYRLNILDNTHAAVVIYIHFLRTKSGKAASKKTSEYLFMTLLEYGYKPYRLHIDLQEKLLKNAPQPKWYQTLKEKFDPLHIIAQGRYGLY